MSTLAILDLGVSKVLDRQALAAVSGRGMNHYVTTTTTAGAWGGWSAWNYDYQGQTFHDGYLSKHYVVTKNRYKTDKQTEIWNQYIRV